MIGEGVVVLIPIHTLELRHIQHLLVLREVVIKQRDPDVCRVIEVLQSLHMAILIVERKN